MYILCFCFFWASARRRKCFWAFYLHLHIYLRRRASSRTVGLYIFCLLPFQQVPRRGKILGYFINLSKHLSRAAATSSGLYMFCLCVFLAIAPQGKFFQGILRRLEREGGFEGDSRGGLTPSLVRGGSAKTLAVGLVFCTVVWTALTCILVLLNWIPTPTN